MMPQQISEMRIATKEVAQNRLIKKLVNEGYILKSIFPINNNRYSIIEFKYKKIMLMFKRDLFLTFGMRFRSLGKTGAGESVNCEDLKLALRLGVTDLYFIYTNGSCYEISLMNFLRDSLKWINKENKEVRSISIHELKKKHDLK